MPSTINAIPDITTGQLRKSGAADANLVLQTNGANAVTIDQLQNPTFSSTGSIKIPSGTTAQRPSPAVNGMVRYNTDYGGLLESYINGAWTAVTGSYTYTATYLVVAGGGGGGGIASVNYVGGGGGAGGLLANSTTLTGGTVYTITVGSGGAAGANGVNGTAGTNGSNSTAFSVTSLGGGGGGASFAASNGGNGLAGGSGGGGGGGGPLNFGGSGGSGTSGQGFAGGGATGAGDGWSAAGGGAGGIGGSTSSAVYGTAGAGANSSITGSNVTYAIGGTAQTASRPTPTPNRGFGGNPTGVGGYSGAGSSGVVIISVPTTNFSNTYTGSNVAVATSGSNTVISFYSSGTYTA